MGDSNKLQFDTMSEAEFELVMKLLQGGDPDVIASEAGIAKKKYIHNGTPG